MNSHKEKQLILDKRTALVKAESFCAYQERSQQELRDKLYEWGLKSFEVEEVITELISTNFLNEERFTIAYVSGKINIKKWGKLKVNQGLKLKRVPEKMILKALKNVDGEIYFKNLQSLADKKVQLLTEKDAFKKRQKLISHLLGKGYEFDLINEVLKTK